MENYVEINTFSISDYLLEAQFDSLKNKTALLDSIIEDIVFQVRKMHGIESKNPFEVPRYLKSSICHLIVEAIQSRYPTLRLSEDQVRNAENARKFIKSSIPRSSIVARSRKDSVKRTHMKGI